MARQLRRTDRPVREMVTARVREMICARALKPGDALPSYEEIGRELAASRVTVKRGMDDLEGAGLIERVPFRGTFIRREIPQIERPLGHIGVIYPSSRHHFFTTPYMTEIMAGVTRWTPPQSDVRLFSLREDGLVNASHLNDSDVGGVLLIGVENDEYLGAFARWGKPGVVVDYCSKAVPLDFIACDNAAAARAMAAHLASLGHRRVAYVASHFQSPVKNPRDPRVTLLGRDSSDKRERRDESLRALRELNTLVEDWMFPEADSEGIPATADKLQRLRRAAARPTAILAASNTLALGLLGELESRGLRVPEDISVCAVASDGDMTAGARTLTCCRFDFTGMGRKAIQLLAERRRTRPPDAPREHRIGFEFVEGQTVKKAKRKNCE